MKKIIFQLALLSLVFISFAAPETVNRDQPLNGDWELGAQKVWEVSRYGRQPMAYPELQCISENGSLCIYDARLRLFFVVGADGGFKASFGKRGEGPGEVRHASSCLSTGNKFIVHDRPKLHYFLEDGSYEKSIPIRGRFDPPVLFLNENEYISLPKRTKGEITYVNLEKNERKFFGTAPDYEAISFAGGRMSIIIPWITPAFALDYDAGTGRIYYGTGDSYLIHIIAPEGDTGGSFSLKRKKRKITRKMQKAHDKENPGESRMMSPAMRKRIPKEMSYFQRLRVIDGWVVVFVTGFGDLPPEQEMDIFSMDGRYTYRTVFRPEAGKRVYYRKLIISNGHLYVSLQDKKGKWTIAKYKITLPNKNEG